MQNVGTRKTRVGLLFGGRSGEHEVSIASALSVYQALDKSRFDVTLIAIDKKGRWMLPDLKQIEAFAVDPLHAQLAPSNDYFSLVPYHHAEQIVAVGQAKNQVAPVDVIFPVLHGTYGEDGTVQGLLELAQIPYVGSGVVGSALGMDKDLSRRLMAAVGIRTVPTLCLRLAEYNDNPPAAEASVLASFNLPLFIKPANAGSSVGVHKVKTAGDLGAAIRDAFRYDHKILVEKAIPARELECSVLGNANPKISVIGEAKPTHEFYSYEAKYLDEGGATFDIPAQNLTEPQRLQIREWALLAFRTLECRGLARVDFFLDRDTGELYLNEINTLPGFTRISMYPKMWAASGLEYGALLEQLIRLAFENYAERNSLKTTRELVGEEDRT